MLGALLGGVQRFGARGITLCAHIGRSGRFLISILTAKPKLRQIVPLLVEQLYFVGVLSLSIILLSGAFIGMVVALQGYHTLQKFGATQQLGQLLALSVVRELGPVVSALLFAGRAGTALTAEIALMRTTEQLSSMSMMAVDPLWRVVAPRFWAGVLAMPVLAMLFNVVSIISGYWVSTLWLGVDAGSFWTNMQTAVSFHNDILNGLIKSVVFGIVVTWVAVYQGFYATPTAEGMGRATTQSVVFASLLVLGLDFVLTAMMLEGW